MEIDASQRKTYKCQQILRKTLRTTGRREMQMETTMRTTSFQLEWLSSKNQKVTESGEVVEKKVPYYTVGGNINWYNHHGKQFEGLSKH